MLRATRIRIGADFNSPALHPLVFRETRKRDPTHPASQIIRAMTLGYLTIESGVKRTAMLPVIPGRERSERARNP
jgi:hypothetical protein